MSLRNAWEVERARRWLKCRFARRALILMYHRVTELANVVSFAYPHGASSPATAGIVRAAGFQSACCSRPDALFRGADHFQSARLGIRDWDRDTFATWLKWWIGH